MICHTIVMVTKIAVTLDQKTVADLDRWVREGRYPNRSRTVQSAVDLLADREKRNRLARELAKLDRAHELQSAFRHGDRDGDHESATSRGLPVDAGAPARLPAPPFVGQD